MIEKVMKAVKRSSKRRSVNITIGAVVGFLLSCTTVMGAEIETALWIEGNGTSFTPNTAIEETTFEGNVYTNNGLISSENSDEKLVEGIKVTGTSNDKVLSIVNKGTINTESTGTGGSVGISLYRVSDVKGTIKNDGAINSTATVNTSYGIVTDGTLTGNIENNGAINSTSNEETAYGILLRGGTLTGNIKNNGVINSTSNNNTKYSYGIYNNGTLTGNIENNGVINSTADKNNSGIYLGASGIEDGILKNNGIINSTSSGTGDSNGIYIGKNLTKGIENTGTINAANTGTGKSYGIRLDAKSDVQGIIKNNGIINSSSKKESNFGLYAGGSLAGNIENDGIINTTSDENYACGIYIHSDSEIKKDIINRGLITSAITSNAQQVAIGVGGFGTGDKISNTGYINVNNNERNAFGILVGATNSNGKVNRITNTGNIYANSEERDGNGIEIDSTPEGGTDISNDGLINTTKYGIEIEKAGTINTLVKSLINEGVIYGKEKAIFKDGKSNLGEGTKANYGLLISEGNDRDSILNGTNFETIQNYGMAFSVGTNGKYYLQKSKEYTGDGRTIVNAQLNETGNYSSTGEVNGTLSESTSDLEDNHSNGYLINGIENTLVVNEDITLKTSIVNAYGTAVVMKDGKVLTAEGTIFNGGIKIKPDKAEGNIPTPTISLAGNNTLNLSKESIVNGNMEIGGEKNTLSMDKSSVNGKITAEGKDNNLTIAESYLNDEMAITGDNNTLDMSKSSMNGKVEAKGNKNNLSINKSIVNGEFGVEGNENKLTIADSYLNDEMTIIGNNNTLDMNKSSINGKVEAKGDNNNLAIADSGINDKIAIDGKDNILTISGDNTFINGDMKATEDSNNTVKLAGKSTDGSSLNMFNKVTGFENMDITGGNVTFFENAEVTGVKNLTVAADGTLSLRLKKVEGETTEDGLEKGGHAFSGNGAMTMTGLDDGGTLQFMTNGIGKGVWIDTSDMQIKNMTIETNSVLDGYKFDESGKLVLKPYEDLAGMSQSGSKVEDSKNPTGDGSDIFEHENFESIDEIYKGMHSSTGDNLNAARDIAKTDRNTGEYSEGMSAEEQMKNLQAYLNEIYTQSPYALSSELSRRSAGMFRDIVTENMFRPNLNQWMIMGGLTHIDGGTKDTYYGEVYQLDGKNSLNTEADMKLTGAYALGKYGYSENVALGVTVGGNRSEAELSKSKVKGNSGYIGAFAENYRGNLTLKAGAGIQYSEYDADRSTVGGHSYNDKYSDMTYDIYLNGRYSNPVGENLFLEPYATLSYTYVDQDGTDEGSKALAIKTDSKSFEYTSAEVGVDLKKVIPHEKGKSTLSAGVSYTRLFNGADSDKLTGNFGGSDFDILVAGKNKHNLGLNAKYTLELQSGVLFDVKGSYSFERDSHKDNARNRNKGEWMVGAGLGYKF